MTSKAHPFLRPAVEKAIEEFSTSKLTRAGVAKMLAAARGPTTAASFGKSKTYATGGIVRPSPTWMAHRATYPTPFPYGTILRPRSLNPRTPQSYARLMVIGPLPASPGEATLLLRVDGPRNPVEFHAWTNEALPDAWEPET